LWVFAAALDYAISVIYWRTGLPYAEGVAALCDASVCLAIYFNYRERWEKIIYRLFQISLTVNIFYLAGNLCLMATVDQDTYATILELLNGLVLLLIGGMGVAEWVGAQVVYAHRPLDRVGRALRSLRTARKTPAFHRIP
jgi:hypothetical protein